MTAPPPLKFFQGQCKDCLHLILCRCKLGIALGKGWYNMETKESLNAKPQHLLDTKPPNATLVIPHSHTINCIDLKSLAYDCKHSKPKIKYVCLVEGYLQKEWKLFYPSLTPDEGKCCCNNGPCVGRTQEPSLRGQGPIWGSPRGRDESILSKGSEATCCVCGHLYEPFDDRQFPCLLQELRLIYEVEFP